MLNQDTINKLKDISSRRVGLVSSEDYIFMHQYLPDLLEIHSNVKTYQQLADTNLHYGIKMTRKFEKAKNAATTLAAIILMKTSGFESRVKELLRDINE